MLTCCDGPSSGTNFVDRQTQFDIVQGCKIPLLSRHGVYKLTTLALPCLLVVEKSGKWRAVSGAAHVEIEPITAVG